MQAFFDCHLSEVAFVENGGRFAEPAFFGSRMT